MPQLIDEDVSVTITVWGGWCEFEPLTVIVKPALGSWQVGGRESDGLAEGDELDEAVGAADAGIPAGGSGNVAMFWTDEAVNVTFWLPPKNAPINGVSRRKCPL